MSKPDENKPKNLIQPLTTVDTSQPKGVENELLKEKLESEITTVDLDFFWTLLPEGQKLREELVRGDHAVKGNTFVKTDVANAMMLAWALQSTIVPILTDILSELRELNGKKVEIKEEPKKVGRPKKE